MKFWFTASRGKTCHNQPSSPNYVKGEPPLYPKNEINYRIKCLNEGFARIGYPNTGNLDLNEFGHGRLAPNGYTFTDVDTISKSSLTKGQLRKFSTIKAGDIIMMPADKERFQIHFGMVLKKDKMPVMPDADHRPNAYYYYYDLAQGDYYECAHRVNVRWAKDGNGRFDVFFIPEIKGTWIKAFGQFDKARYRILQMATEAGFFDVR